MQFQSNGGDFTVVRTFVRIDCLAAFELFKASTKVVRNDEVLQVGVKQRAGRYEGFVLVTETQFVAHGAFPIEGLTAANVGAGTRK